LLAVHDLSVRYGSSLAIKGVSLEISTGEVRAILGANGAGKTTILKTIMGALRPSGGTITYRGEQIHRVPAHRMAALGIALVPEGRRILTTMSVEENLEMGAYVCGNRQTIRERMDQMYERFPRLRERRRQTGGTLSGGEQQMLAFARALMPEPQLLLLDEPSLGLAPLIIKELFFMIGEINRQGMTILLVEQNAKQALLVSDWVYVLAAGEVVVADSAARLMADEAVQMAYLGG
jgi:branched-chain amino acid transport system ATP-binding protein